MTRPRKNPEFNALSKEEKQKAIADKIAKTARKKGSGAPLGNKNWMHRLTHGQPRVFTEPEDLLMACLEYLEWCEDNPLEESKAFNNNGKPVYATIKKMRAPLIKQMCVHIGISYPGWKLYTQRDDEHGQVARAINQIIHDWKLQGAYAGLLESIIAHRDLNMIERFNVESERGTMTPKAPEQIDLTAFSMKELKTLASLAEKLGNDTPEPDADN